jgi:Mechanosensitive ion channel
VHVLRRAGGILIALVTAAAALMSFESVRAYGLSLFASAGAAGLVVGLAARPLLTNLIAGVQIAVTQPIRLEDAVIVEGEGGVGRGDRQHLRCGPAVGLAAHGPAAVLLPGEAVPELDARDRLADRLGVPLRGLLGAGGASRRSRSSPCNRPSRSAR